ncbi:MAG: hypothetical protein K2O85_05575 [Helicobacter sp.]|nr:hypothetical protein [Helicobacter sp.]
MIRSSGNRNSRIEPPKTIKGYREHLDKINKKRKVVYVDENDPNYLSYVLSMDLEVRPIPKEKAK